MMRIKPAVTTSRNATKYDLCGEKPAVATDSMTPSKLHATEKVPDLMPLRVTAATSSGFIGEDEATMMLQSSGLVLRSGKK